MTSDIFLVGCFTNCTVGTYELTCETGACWVNRIGIKQCTIMSSSILVSLLD